MQESKFQKSGPLLSSCTVRGAPEISHCSLPNLTLVIGARYDTMDLAHMEAMASQVQKGRYLFCPNGSHQALYDDQKVYVAGVIQFVRDVDTGAFDVAL